MDSYEDSEQVNSPRSRRNSLSDASDSDSEVEFDPEYPELLDHARYLGYTKKGVNRMIRQFGIDHTQDILADKRRTREQKKRREREFKQLQNAYLAKHPQYEKYRWIRVSSYDDGDEEPTVFHIPRVGPGAGGINVVEWLNIPNLLRTAFLLNENFWNNGGLNLLSEYGDQIYEWTNVGHWGILVVAYGSSTKEFLRDNFELYEKMRLFIIDALPRFEIAREYLTGKSLRALPEEPQFFIIDHQNQERRFQLTLREYGSLQKFFGDDEINYLFHGSYHVRNLMMVPIRPGPKVGESETIIHTSGLDVEIRFWPRYNWNISPELQDTFLDIYEGVLAYGADFKIFAAKSSKQPKEQPRKFISVDSLRLRSTCKLFETFLQTKLGRSDESVSRYESDFSIQGLRAFQAGLYFNVSALDELVTLEILQELYEIYAYTQCTILPLGYYLNGCLGKYLLEFDDVGELLETLLSYGYAPEADLMVGQLQNILDLWNGRNNAGGYSLTDKQKELNFKIDWPVTNRIIMSRSGANEGVSLRDAETRYFAGIQSVGRIRRPEMPPGAESRSAGTRNTLLAHSTRPSSNSSNMILPMD